MLIPSYAIGPNPNSRGYSLQFPLGGSRRGGARDAGLGRRAAHVSETPRHPRHHQPARPQRRSLLVEERNRHRRSHRRRPFRRHAGFAQAADAGHAGTADRDIRYRAAPLYAEMLRRPGPDQFRRRSLLDSPRRLASDGSGAGAVRALSLSAFPQDPAALAEAVKSGG